MTKAGEAQEEEEKILKKGESLVVNSSRYPLLTMSRVDTTTDWVSDITNLLKWNTGIKRDK